MDGLLFLNFCFVCPKEKQKNNSVKFYKGIRDPFKAKSGSKIVFFYNFGLYLKKRSSTVWRLTFK